MLERPLEWGDQGLLHTVGAGWDIAPRFSSGWKTHVNRAHLDRSFSAICRAWDVCHWGLVFAGIETPAVPSDFMQQIVAWWCALIGITDPTAIQIRGCGCCAIADRCLACARSPARSTFPKSSPSHWPKTVLCIASVGSS